MAQLGTFRVGLLITERCNVECSHCWFGCGPHKTAEMTLSEATDYIDQALEIPTVKWISFTGGEPFLLTDLLVDLVKYASGKGLETECVTNCFWAESREAAEGVLRRLVEAGLDVVNISADDFHQRHIPFDRVRNCYHAAKALGLRIVIMCAASRSSELRVERVASLLDEGGIRILGRDSPTHEPSALAIETGFLPVGRGTDIPETELVTSDEPLEGPCRTVLQDIAVTPSGEVLPCCSAAGLTDAAHVGNAKRKKLGELMEEASRRPLFRVLSTEGPRGLLRLLEPESQRKHVSRCHLCIDVLRDPRLPRALSDLS